MRQLHFEIDCGNEQDYFYVSLLLLIFNTTSKYIKDYLYHTHLIITFYYLVWSVQPLPLPPITGKYMNIQTLLYCPEPY